MSTLSEMEKKAEALKIKQERAVDAAEAMREFEAEKASLLNNTLRLRAMRLEREAQQAQEEQLSDIKKTAQKLAAMQKRTVAAKDAVKASGTKAAPAPKKARTPTKKAS